MRQYARAESLFREAVRRYGDTLDPDHPLVGVAHVRLGDVLLKQDRLDEAEATSLAAYGILNGQSSPPPRWFSLVCANLATIYEKWEQPEKAAEFRACSSSAEAEPGK
jgi:tetratricopeptide (TPR) repeat protein